jgi:hypothetical protein
MQALQKRRRSWWISFDRATSYWKAADALEGLALKTPRNHAPIRFLYFHALELYLKAYLRAHGYTVKRLEEIGHSRAGYG